MKILLILFPLLASTLSAEIFDGSEVSYSYDLEMNNDESIIKYFVDSTYYDKYLAEVIGVYIIYNGIPMSISKDLRRMNQILNHYINLRTGSFEPKLIYEDSKIEKLKNREMENLKKIANVGVFNKFSHKYHNNHIEMRDIDLFLTNKTRYKDIHSIKKNIENYIYKKKGFYLRQNNTDGVKFCEEIERYVLKPLSIITQKTYTNDTSEKPLKSLSKEELKIIWDDFKDSKLGLIQTYFDANDDKLVQLDVNNTFNVGLNFEDWSEFPVFYICLRIFDQKWYLKIDDSYISNLHKVKLIEL